jgi:protein-L-isoaspartate O-methyltransferase
LRRDFRPIDRAQAIVSPHHRLIEAVLAQLFAWRAETDHPVVSPGVLAAMATIAREPFVPPHLQGRAYDDVPLDIEAGQRIRQSWGKGWDDDEDDSVVILGATIAALPQQ